MEFSHVSLALIAFSVFVVVYLILRKNSEKQINIKLEGRDTSHKEVSLAEF
jgi:hypothetical protein